MKFQITDSDPGVDPANTQATLDGAPVQSGQVLDLFNLLPGPHALRIHAVDWAGNTTESSVTFTVTATPRSTEYEVARMLQLGWIPRWRTEAMLIQALEMASPFSLKAFIAVIANPRQRPQDQPLMTAAAATQLTATAQYLLQLMGGG